MHLSLIVIAVSVAWIVRGCWSDTAWTSRWQQALWRFLFAPLLLIMTALAVLCMGIQGEMLGLPVGWMGYSLALGFLGYAGAVLLWLIGQGWRSIRAVQRSPKIEICGTTGRMLEVADAIAAQVGFWQSDLVVSRGLVALLTPAQLAAVLTHEQAHHYYRDTFWFFWLGWLRQLASWLPQTEALWQELLLLRELRADEWAAQRVDALLLAESLLLVVQAPLHNSHCAAFSAVAPPNRLSERIEALISPPLETPPASNHHLIWMGLMPTVLPLLTVLLHN